MTDENDQSGAPVPLRTASRFPARVRGDFTQPGEDEDQPLLPADPASVAAGLLLRRALASAGTTAEEAAQDGTVCTMLVPDATWTALAADQWRERLRGGTQPETGSHSDWLSERWSWAEWSPDEPERASYVRSSAERFARAVARGWHCLGVAADLGWLPADLVRAADHQLELPALLPGDVGELARELCGDAPSEALEPKQAEALTPRLLRLARRPGQSADAYVRKLGQLLDRDRAPKPKDRADSPRAAPTLDRLHGMDEAVAWGMALARDIDAYRAGALPWSAVDRGALLSGPPGVGKTLFARALAASCGVPLVCGSYGQWHGSGSAHQGDLLKAMRKTFADAHSSAPSILFVDEIDSFPNRATVTHSWADWEIQVVNALLAEVDGADAREGVVLLGACNSPEKLDPALCRSGRLDRHIRIRPPERAALARILREHLGSDLPEADLESVAIAATGCTGADCERLVRGARRTARQAGRQVAVEDLMTELEGSAERDPEVEWIAAIHEAGHALAACDLCPGWLSMVSLAGTEQGGSTRTMLPGGYMRPRDVETRLVLVLAGRAAEETIFGVPSSGAGGSRDSDLAQATALAVKAEGALGLGGTLTWRGGMDQRQAAELLASDARLARRVHARLEAAYAAALDLLRLRTTALEALAREMVSRRVLDGAEAEAIVRMHSGAGERQADCGSDVVARAADALPGNHAAGDPLLRGVLFYGDPHGEWRPLLEACATEPPAAVVIVGDLGLTRPFRQELEPVLALGSEVWWIPGNHDANAAEAYDRLWGDAPDWNLHCLETRLGGLTVAGLGGVFKQRIWYPREEDSKPAYPDRASYLRQLKPNERWRGGLPLRVRDAIFPEDVAFMRRLRADVLVTHEAPSCHRYGFVGIDAAAAACRARLVVHGHHHESYEGVLPGGVRVRGLGIAEVFRLTPEALG